MKKIVMSMIAVSLLGVFATTVMAQSSSGRWKGPTKGPSVTFKSTGRGTPVTKPGYSSYRYNTPTPTPIPFQSLKSADPGGYRSSPPVRSIPPKYDDGHAK